MDANVLPPELLLEIFPLLTLKSLISALGVNKQWRRLIPLSNLFPARRALLNLYCRAIESQRFQETRSTILPHVWPFDRDAYVAELEASLESFKVGTLGEEEEDRYSRRLPEDFRLWLLEWPACAVIGRVWPGLGYSSFSETIGPQGYNGLVNFFARHPKVGIIHCDERVDGRRVERRKMLAIEVWWHSRSWSSWLVIDGHKAEVDGGVHGVVVMWTSVHHKIEASSWADWLEAQLRD